jgi:hypothetical protein
MFPLNFQSAFKSRFLSKSCSESTPSGAPRPRKIFPLPFRDRISKFWEENDVKHASIIAKGPLLPFYGNGKAPRQANQLPRSAFRLYDMDGNETEFRFETNAIFSHPSTGLPDRIFYSEISDVRFRPIPGYENVYAQMTFDTKVGIRTFFYLPMEYEDIIRRVIKQ